ncbi:MAG: hypothetical protein DHS20C16_28090 [Phycisphaerae bacterium]|nr:MAG: hypothetical protein DHS20C16_28090 [Phycisphaerae bacterium]
MLGWAFPAYLSGGVGTACQGLCRALTQLGVGIDFIMSGPGDAETDGGGAVPDGVDAVSLAGKPDSIVGESLGSKHGRLADSWDAAIEHAKTSGEREASPFGAPAGYPHLEFIRINVGLQPYQRPGESGKGGVADCQSTSASEQTGAGSHATPGQPRQSEEERRTNLFSEVDCYTHQAIQAVAGREFLCVHAHDWMTFQAGAAIAESTGKPFVAHVHSTEYERTAHQIDQSIFEIEKQALMKADAVIAVSHMAREVLIRRYEIDASKITVVYNGVDCPESNPAMHPTKIVRDEKIVLFMGRMTLQKGPEYFLAAARKVLAVMGNVRFIMAGSGELLEQTMGLADQLGIADRVIFPGFLRGDEVERAFRSADLYVMPSVSDPFGIAALEAASFDVPVLVSRQSGVSEVMSHVLKADFWDIDDMADKIVAVLRHPPLQAALRKHGGFEVRNLKWSNAARQVVEVYQTALKHASVA